MIAKALLNIFGLAIGVFLLLFLFLNLVIAKGVLIEDLAGPASTILAGLAAVIGAVMTISQMRTQHRKEVRLISKSMELQHFENYKKSVEEALDGLLQKYSGYVGRLSSQNYISFSAPDFFYEVHDISSGDVIPPLEVDAIMDAIQEVKKFKANVKLVDELLDGDGEINEERVIKTLGDIASIVNFRWAMSLEISNRLVRRVELPSGETCDVLLLDTIVYFQFIELFCSVASRLHSINSIYRAKLGLHADLDEMGELIMEANHAWMHSRGEDKYEVTSFLDDIS
jgi:hypothetical protein